MVAMNKWQTITDMEVNEGRHAGRYAMWSCVDLLS